MSDRATTTRTLAKWALSLEPRGIPKAAVEQTKLLILDSIGCAIAAIHEHEPEAAVKAILGQGGAPLATIIGSPKKTSAVNAVLANGILVRHLDHNDFFVGEGKAGPVIGGHPSDNIAVALAIGEWQKKSGREIIAAIVLGYELYYRLHDMQDRDTPWDGSTMSGLVSAAMAGRLMGLDESRMAHALALAISRAATPRLVRQGEVTAAKVLANPLVVQSGTVATILAAAGLTGPLAVLDDPDAGLRRLFPADMDMAEITAPLPADLAIIKSNVKAYPCLATGQGAAAAGIRLHKALKGRLDDIEKIEVFMIEHSFIQRQQDDQDRRHPNSKESADHSFYFIPAVAMVDGELTPRQYDNARWTDPVVLGLMKKMVMRSDPALNRLAPKGYPCRLRVVMRDGREEVAEIDYPPGYSKGGLIAAEIHEKFDAITRDALGDEQRQAVKDGVSRLEKRSSVAGLMRLLRF